MVSSDVSRVRSASRTDQEEWLVGLEKALVGGIRSRVWDQVRVGPAWKGPHHLLHIFSQSFFSVHLLSRRLLGTSVAMFVSCTDCRMAAVRSHSEREARRACGPRELDID